jgi:large subunit ribosomal protein L24
MKKIKRDDTVVLLTGKDKGKQGKVLRLDEDRVLVEGVNFVHKHVRPNPQKGIKGGIEKKEAPVHISNVALIDAVSGKSGRVGFKVNDQGDKERVIRAQSRRGVS